MKIVKIKDFSSWISEVITKDYHTWKIIPNKNWNKKYYISPWWELLLHSLLFNKEDLTWEYWLNSIIAWIKNVELTYKDYLKRIEFEKEMVEEHLKALKEWKKWWKRLLDYYKSENSLIQTVQDYPENMREEEIKQVPFSWWDWEVNHAESCVDFTEVGNYDWTNKEYYKTSEVLEVLEKWKEALERWNNPDEKKKMIEEFDKNNKK